MKQSNLSDIEKKNQKIVENCYYYIVVFKFSKPIVQVDNIILLGYF